MRLFMVCSLRPKNNIQGTNRGNNKMYSLETFSTTFLEVTLPLGCSSGPCPNDLSSIDKTNRHRGP